MSTYPEFLVRIDCITYNHAPYIEDAMNGFCMQQTTFPFVATIIDDASTDGEPEVIRRYLDAHFDLSEKGLSRQWETDDAYFIYAHHKENKNCYFAVVLLKYNFWQAKKSKEPLIKEWINTKYVAFCEGDDYWTDESKLQEQVKVLNGTPNIMFVYTGFETVDEKGNRISRPMYDKHQQKSFTGDNLEQLFEGNYILTLTVCIRRNILEKKLYRQSPFHYDYALFLCASMYGDSYYINSKTGCYRQHSQSLIATQKNKVVYGNGETLKYFVVNFFKQEYKPMPFLKRIKLKKALFQRFLDNGLYDEINQIATVDVVGFVLFLRWRYYMFKSYLYKLFVKSGFVFKKEESKIV